MFCIRLCSISLSFHQLSLSLWAVSCAKGVSHFLNATQLHGPINLCVCVSVFACVTELARMVCPSPINRDNKRQPWALREISIIREKHRELEWLRGTRLAKTFWGILDLWWVGDSMTDKPSVGNRWARQLQLREPSYTEGEAIFSKQRGQIHLNSDFHICRRAYPSAADIFMMELSWSAPVYLAVDH